MNFIKLTEADEDIDILVNIENIVIINPGTARILVNGVHCLATGYYHITQDSLQRLLLRINALEEVGTE